MNMCADTKSKKINKNGRYGRVRARFVQIKIKDNMFRIRRVRAQCYQLTIRQKKI